MAARKKVYVIESFRTYSACPLETVYVVELADLDGKQLNSWPPDHAWVFGPRTTHPWPNGDYYSRGEYIEQASNVPSLDPTLLARSLVEYQRAYRMARPILREFYIDEGL